MSVILTNRQKLVLAHKVEFPQKWADNAGEKAVRFKVSKYENDFDIESAKPNYLNRVERDAKEENDLEVARAIPNVAAKLEIQRLERSITTRWVRSALSGEQYGIDKLKEIEELIAVERAKL